MLGNKLAASAVENCGTCELRSACRDKAKSRRYKCSFYVEELTASAADPSDRQFAKYLQALSRSESVVADPFQIDDGDAPTAPNFYEWATSKSFLAPDPIPYPKQLQLGIRIFGDACPECSDQDWYDDIPHDCDYREIPERLALYHNGRCNTCRRTRLYYTNRNYDKDYNELIAIVGQRAGKCIDGDALVNTARGLVPMRSVVVGDDVIVNGVGHAVSRVYKSTPKPMFDLVTRSGYRLTLTGDHPVYTPAGYAQASRAKVVMVELDRAREAPPDARRRAKSRRWLAAAHAATSEYGRPSKSKLTAAALPKQTLAVQREFVRTMAAESMAVGGALLLRYPSDRVAEAAQLTLVGFRVHSRRVGATIIVDQPFARRYTREVGVVNPTVARAFVLAARRQSDRVDEFSSELVKQLVQSTHVVGEFTHPEASQLWTTVMNSLRNGTFTKRDAVRALSALQGSDRFHAVVLNDRLAQSALVEVIRRVLRKSAVWDRVAEMAPAGLRTCYDVEVPSVRCFVANGLRVHNSTSMAFIFSYHQHRLLKLRNPSAFYGIKAGTILETTFVGIQYGTVKRYVFDPYLASIADSPWHKTYHEILDAAARHRGEEPYYKVMDQFLYYRHAALRTYPASPSTRALRGATRVGITVDELSHFSSDAKKVNISGLEVWRALTRSLQTVRNKTFLLHDRGVVNVPPALSVAITSPREAADPGMVLYNQPAPNTYSVLLPTWEFNPEYTRKSLAAEFARDEQSAWRDFGARPPLSSLAFISGIDPFRAVVDRTALPAFDVVPTILRSKKRRRVLSSARLKWRWTDVDVPKIMAIDAGHVLNSFAVTVMHLNEDGHPVYDGFAEVHPTPGRPVSFAAAMENVIKPIIEKLGVVAVVSDRWQNVRTGEQLEEECGVMYEAYRLKYSDFLAWREALYAGEMELPRPEMHPDQIIAPEGDVDSYFKDSPVAALVWQSVSVIDSPGRTVEKPTIGNDDLFRVAVLANAGAQIPEIQAVLASGAVRRRGEGVIGVATLATGGTTITLAHPGGDEDYDDAEESNPVIAASIGGFAARLARRPVQRTRAIGYRGGS